MQKARYDWVVCIEPGFADVHHGNRTCVCRDAGKAYLRCRILARIRRFLRPIFRRPLPVFFVPILSTTPRGQGGNAASVFELMLGKGDWLSLVARHPAVRGGRNLISIAERANREGYQRLGVPANPVCRWLVKYRGFQPQTGSQCPVNFTKCAERRLLSRFWECFGGGLVFRARQRPCLHCARCPPNA